MTETKIPNRVLKLEPVSKEDHAREQKVAAQEREAAQQRHDAEARMLSQRGTPVKHTDPPRDVKLELPKPSPVVVAPRPVQKAPPAPVVVPKHEERPIPAHEPPKPPQPPRQGTKPPQPPPPPKKEDKPPQPPRLPAAPTTNCPPDPFASAARRHPGAARASLDTGATA